MAESPAIQIIFSLLKSQLCQRSTSHLLLALSLLELVLSATRPQAPQPPPAARELPAVPEEGEPAQASDSVGRQAATDTDTPMEGVEARASGSVVFHCRLFEHKTSLTISETSNVLKIRGSPGLARVQAKSPACCVAAQSLHSLLLLTLLSRLLSYGPWLLCCQPERPALPAVAFIRPSCDLK